MPLLDKRLEVLGYALREAVEQMDFNLIHHLAEKAIATPGRIATEQLRRVHTRAARAARRHRDSRRCRTGQGDRPVHRARR